MNHTAEFLREAALRPADAQALTEVPEEVRAELSERIAPFLKFLPQIIAVVRIWTGEGTTQEKIAATLEVLFALIPQQ